MDIAETNCNRSHGGTKQSNIQFLSEQSMEEQAGIRGRNLNWQL